MSGRVGSNISESAVVANVRVAIRIASITLADRVLFPLPVSTSGLVADIFGFRCWPMSGRHGSAICESGIVENVRGGRWSRVANTFRSSAISTSGFHFRFRGRYFGFPMLVDVGPCRQCHF